MQGGAGGRAVAGAGAGINDKSVCLPTLTMCDVPSHRRAAQAIARLPALRRLEAHAMTGSSDWAADARVTGALAQVRGRCLQRKAVTVQRRSR